MEASRIPALVVAVSCWVLFTGGCSWAMVQQAPAEYAVEGAAGPPDCTTSLGPAIGDTWDTIAVGGGLIASGIISTTVFEVEPSLGVAQVVGGAALGSMFGASALHGYAATRRCRRLTHQYQTELHRRLEALEAASPTE